MDLQDAVHAIVDVSSRHLVPSPPDSLQSGLVQHICQLSTCTGIQGLGGSMMMLTLLDASIVPTCLCH